MCASRCVHKMSVSDRRYPLYVGHTRRRLPRSAEGTPMSVASAIREKLTAAFAPDRLEVINESELHAGHRGSPGTGESHFRVVIVSTRFAGLSRLARHRLVNEVLAAELSGTIHALALSAYAPGDEVR